MINADCLITLATVKEWDESGSIEQSVLKADGLKTGEIGMWKDKRDSNWWWPDDISQSESLLGCFTGSTVENVSIRDYKCADMRRADAQEEPMNSNNRVMRVQGSLTRIESEG